MKATKQVTLYHTIDVELPKDAYEINFLLACSIIREQFYASGEIARQQTFWVTRDCVYAKMKDSELYYEIKVEIS